MRCARPSRLAVPLALVVFGVGGCASRGDSSGTAESPAAARPSSTAKLAIVRPENGSVIHGSTVDLVLDLKGARIVQATSKDLRPDEGHVHVILDGKLVSMNYGLHETIEDVRDGRHLLQAEFVATDHAPFDPRVIAVTSFEVKP
jgi:hypothetical protein